MKLASTALALLVLAFVAGCGDDDETTTTTEGATGATGAAGAIETREDFIAAADAICKIEGDAFAKAAEDQYPEGPPEGADADAFGEEVVIPNLQSQHDQLAELDVPKGDEDEVREILEGLQIGIDELSEDPGSFVTTDAFDEVNALAQDYGLKECGSE